MEFRGFKLLALLLCALACLSVSEAAELLVGDANSDGKVDRVDADLLYQALYASKPAPKGQQASAMDVDGDGVVDIDDLLDLRELVSSRRPAQRRTLPARPPEVTPRGAEGLRTIRSNTGEAMALEHRLEELKDPIHYFMPSESYLREVASFRRDLELAIRLGLDAGKAARLKLQLDRIPAERAAEIASWLHYRPEGRRYVEACAARLPPGTHWLRGFDADWNCGAVVTYSHKFSVATEGGRLAVRMPLRIEFDPTLSTADLTRFSKRWTRATQCVSAFWSRYGVDFAFDLSAEAARSATAHFEVTSGDGRGHLDKLFVNSAYSINLCAWAIHEFGHWMGIGDEYDEPGDSCRREHSDDLLSIMGLAAQKPIRQAEFRPRHLEGMFGELCGPYPGP